MGKLTHREFRTRIQWMEQQLNVPDRSDYYLMQIAGYVAHVMSSKTWSPDDFKIKFKLGQPTMEERIKQLEASKALWAQRLGKDKGRRYGSRS